MLVKTGERKHVAGVGCSPSEECIGIANSYSVSIKQNEANLYRVKYLHIYTYQKVKIDLLYQVKSHTHTHTHTHTNYFKYS